MMRYTLQDHTGALIGEADTAQGIGDIARPGTWSYDWRTPPQTFYRCMVYRRDTVGLVGSYVSDQYEAMRQCAAIVAQGE